MDTYDLVPTETAASGTLELRGGVANSFAFTIETFSHPRLDGAGVSSCRIDGSFTREGDTITYTRERDTLHMQFGPDSVVVSSNPFFGWCGISVSVAGTYRKR